MVAKQFPSHPNLEHYKKQAKDLVKACAAGRPDAIQRVRKAHPRHRIPTSTEEDARLRSGQILDPDSAVASSLADAQIVIAREHGFLSWPKFAKHVDALTRDNSPVLRFELAADAIVSGDVTVLERLLREDPALIRARSRRAHRCTLLHYVGANGVEEFRQRTPQNAVDVTTVLFRTGAEVDAVADTYGKATTLGLVATSVYPERAGVQLALLDTLLRHGAAIDGPTGTWPPLSAALQNGRLAAAKFLASRGARLGLAEAAALGRIDIVQRFFDDNARLRQDSKKAELDSALVFACGYGQPAVVEFLLARGADLRADENVAQPGLHSAVMSGNLDVVKLLLARGAPLEAKNVFGGTALGQATWCVMNADDGIDFAPIVEILLDAGARIEDADYPTGDERVDRLLHSRGAKS
jgi:hypothetical protein